MSRVRVVHLGRLDGSPLCPAPAGSQVVYGLDQAGPGERLCAHCKADRERTMAKLKQRPVTRPPAKSCTTGSTRW